MKLHISAIVCKLEGKAKCKDTNGSFIGSRFLHVDVQLELDGCADGFAEVVSDSAYPDGYYEILGFVDIDYYQDYYGEWDSSISPGELTARRLTMDDAEQLADEIGEYIEYDLLPVESMRDKQALAYLESPRYIDNNKYRIELVK